MKKNRYFYTNLLAWGLVLFLIGNYVFGWTTPSGNPPTSNLPAPINISSTNQSKEGYLAVGMSTAPSYPLDVAGALRWQDMMYANAGNFAYSGNTYNILYAGTAGLGINNQADTSVLVKILDNGDVGIGDTTPTYKLDVAGTGRFTDNLTGLGFFYSSDESLKENIQDIETPLAKIMKLEGISFDWKKSNKKSIGLIAQDVEKVFPEIVNIEEETGLKSIEYSKLVAPLIEAVKEQQKMIDEQRELIDKQGEEIKTLKSLFE